MKRQVGLNVIEDELDQCAGFCREHGLGIEVTAFAYPNVLENRYDEVLELHEKSLNGMNWISVHGPFLDLFSTSPDPAIVNVCKQRHISALQVAQKLKAQVYVAHLNSLPMINNKQYLDHFVEKAVGFWLPFVDIAGNHNITIVLENMWESTPDLQKEIIEAASHPFLKASFDNGHAKVFSDISSSEWVDVLGNDIAHIHLHDNEGTYDHHWAVGDGNEDWNKLLKSIDEYVSDTAVIVIESDSFEVNKKSLKRLRQLERE